MLCDLCQSVIEKKINDDRIDFPFVDGQHLTRLESIVFEILFERCGRIVPRESLFSLMYHHPKNSRHDGHLNVEPHVITVVVCKMRKKLKGTDFEIVTSFANGYKLVDHSERKAA